MKDSNRIAGSFRDPSGFLFIRAGILYRHIAPLYREHYDHLMESGLYAKLIEAGLLIPHEEVPPPSLSDGAYKVIRPELIRFVSYPYEWCFSQLQDAALTTLKIQKLALEFGMSLKDASAYNIQFHSGRPILIDTLSFEKLPQGKPWIAYRQYCQHFLAPLLLMAYKDIRLSQFLKVYIDGIPLDFASRTLPWFTRFIPSIFLHVHMHALSQKHYASKQADIRARKISRNALIGIIDSLSKATTRIKIRLKKSEWGEYYRDTN